MDTNFDEVWQRVTGTARPDEAAAVRELERLDQMIRDEAADAAGYVRMAASAAGTARKLFNELAVEEREHLRRLQTARYLLWGDSGRPKPEAGNCSRFRTGLQGLRERYAAETAGERTYSEAADDTQDASLRELYRRLAAEERKHAQRIWDLAQRLM